MDKKAIEYGLILLAIGFGVALVIYFASGWYFGSWVYIPNKGNIDAAGPDVTNWFQVVMVKGWDYSWAWLYHWDLASFNAWIGFASGVPIVIVIFLLILMAKK